MWVRHDSIIDVGKKSVTLWSIKVIWSNSIKKGKPKKNHLSETWLIHWCGEKKSHCDPYKRSGVTHIKQERKKIFCGVLQMWCGVIHVRFDSLICVLTCDSSLTHMRFDSCVCWQNLILLKRELTDMSTYKWVKTHMSDSCETWHVLWMLTEKSNFAFWCVHGVSRVRHDSFIRVREKRERVCDIYM